MKNLRDYLREKNRIRKNLLGFTERAYRMLPETEHYSLLDIGCGTGQPTMKLAELTGGKVTGIDIDRDALAVFGESVREAGLDGRVKALEMSLTEMDFPPESFDLIWAEGSAWVTGFEAALRDWIRFLSPGGFLVIHDAVGDIVARGRMINEAGYTLLGCLLLDQEDWLEGYCAPLEEMVDRIAGELPEDPEVVAAMEKDRQEITMMRENPDMARSVYFIMAKD